VHKIDHSLPVSAGRVPSEKIALTVGTGTHQGWIDEESLAAQPGIKLPVVRVPNRWLERAVRTVRLLEREWGHPVRFIATAGLVQVLFRSGTTVGLTCSLEKASACQEALREALRK